MKSHDVESKLTPAAREALEELVDGYREEILLGAMRSAASFRDEVPEIAVRDILEGVKSVNRSETRPSDMPSRFWRTVILVGIAYSVGGFGLFAFRSIAIAFEPLDWVGIVIGLAGFAMAIFGYYYSRYRARSFASVSRRMISDELQSFDRSMLLVQEWRDIELAARNLVASHLGESMADRPVSVLMRELARTDVLTDDDVVTLRQLLSMRNMVLHDKNVEIERESLELALQDASRILSKLERSMD